jgi:hypothetical protein
MKLQEEIAKVAYELYEKSGRIPGRERQNWLEAERIVLTRHASQEIEEPEGEESMVTDEVIIEEVEETRPTYKEREKEEYSAFAEEKKVRSTKVGIKKESAKKTEKLKASKPAAAKGKKLSPKKKTQKSATKKSK